MISVPYLCFAIMVTRRVLTAQDRRLTRSELMNMSVPPEDDVIELMEQLDDDDDRIDTLREDFKRLQDDLDGLILREVYDFDDRDTVEMEEFLEVW